MNRGVLFIALLLLAVGVIGLQTGAYYTFERLFLRTPATIHPTGGNGGSGSGNNSGANDSGGSNSNSQSNSTSNSNYVEVNTIINYGNGTRVWFNQTKILKGLNVFNLTLMLAHNNVKYACYCDWNPPENFVTGINGVPAAPTSSYYWSLWSFCPSDSSWQYSEVGADLITVSDNGIYGWYYQVGTSPPVVGSPTLPIGETCPV